MKAEDLMVTYPNQAFVAKRMPKPGAEFFGDGCFLVVEGMIDQKNARIAHVAGF